MQQFIVSVEFHNEHIDGRAVTVWSETKDGALDAVWAWFAETEPVEYAEAQTVAEFKSDFGKFTDDMFVCINPDSAPTA